MSEQNNSISLPMAIAIAKKYGTQVDASVVENKIEEIIQRPNSIVATKEEINLINESLETITNYKAKSYTFNDVSEMKNSNLIKIGDIVKTLGYYKSNDGGGGEYYIREPYVDGTGGFELLKNGNIACLNVTTYNNIRQFGAKGDGVTDDSVAIRNNANWGGRYGRKVNVPEGVFLINSEIEVQIGFVGDGQHRSYLILGDSGLIKINGIRASLKNMDIGGTPGNSQIGIKLDKAKHCLLENLSIHDFGISVKIENNTWSNTFIKVNMFNNSTCLFAEGAEINNTSFYDCHAHTAEKGFVFKSGDSGFHYKINFFGCQIELCSYCGVVIEANGTFSFNGTYFERNNISNQKNWDNGGIVVGFDGSSGSRPATLDLVGCYHLQSNIKISQSGSNTTTLISNFFKDIRLEGMNAIEILNPSSMNKILNINPSYSLVNTVTNSPNSVYSINSNSLAGTTYYRPNAQNSCIGQLYYDTTISKPIWNDGTNWIDTMGIFVPVPSWKGASGRKGAFSADSNFLYVCVTDNTWIRVAKDPSW